MRYPSNINIFTYPPFLTEENDEARLGNSFLEKEDEKSPQTHQKGKEKEKKGVGGGERRSRAQELCESRGGRLGLSSLISLGFLWT